MARPGNTDIHPLLREIRTEKASGKIHKRFEDDYYALDLIKVRNELQTFYDNI